MSTNQEITRWSIHAERRWNVCRKGLAGHHDGPSIRPAEANAGDALNVLWMGETGKGRRKTPVPQIRGMRICEQGEASWVRCRPVVGVIA